MIQGTEISPRQVLRDQNESSIIHLKKPTPSRIRSLFSSRRDEVRKYKINIFKSPTTRFFNIFLNRYFFLFCFIYLFCELYMHFFFASINAFLQEPFMSNISVFFNLLQTSIRSYWPSWMMPLIFSGNQF